LAKAERLIMLLLPVLEEDTKFTYQDGLLMMRLLLRMGQIATSEVDLLQSNRFDVTIGRSISFMIQNISTPEREKKYLDKICLMEERSETKTPTVKTCVFTGKKKSQKEDGQ
jgi:hypothetical protein